MTLLQGICQGRRFHTAHFSVSGNTAMLRADSNPSRGCPTPWLFVQQLRYVRDARTIPPDQHAIASCTPPGWSQLACQRRRCGSMHYPNRTMPTCIRRLRRCLAHLAAACNSEEAEARRRRMPQSRRLGLIVGNLRSNAEEVHHHHRLKPSQTRRLTLDRGKTLRSGAKELQPMCLNPKCVWRYL